MSRSQLEPHAIAIAVLVVALMGIALACGHSGLTHDDDAGRTAIDAQPTARANVLVNNENHMILGVDAWLIGVNGFNHCLCRQHVDAFPGTNVDAAFAHDAFGLVDVQKLFGFDRLGQLGWVNLLKGVAPRKVRQRRIGVVAHYAPLAI